MHSLLVGEQAVGELMRMRLVVAVVQGRFSSS